MEGDKIMFKKLTQAIELQTEVLKDILEQRRGNLPVATKCDLLEMEARILEAIQVSDEDMRSLDHLAMRSNQISRRAQKLAIKLHKLDILTP